MHLGQSLLQALFIHLSEAYTHTLATLLMKIKCNGKPRHRGTANKLHNTAALKYTECSDRQITQPLSLASEGPPPTCQWKTIFTASLTTAIF